MSWSQQEYLSENPVGKYGSCGAIVGNQILIYGGMGMSGISSELFSFNFSSYKWKLLSQNDPDGPKQVYYCHAHSNKNLFYVIGGEKLSKIPTDAVYEYNLEIKK